MDERFFGPALKVFIYSWIANNILRKSLWSDVLSSLPVTP
jgi:hypothetical protein